MNRKKMWVEWEEGAELSSSRKQPGDFSPLTRDEDNNLGHVILSEIDEDDEHEPSWESDDPPPDWPTEEELEAIALALIAMFVAACRAAPHIHRWWRDQLAPFMKRSARRIRPRRWLQPGERDGQTSVVVHLAPREPRTEVTAALKSYRASMTSDEAKGRFVAALVARMFSDEQLRILRDARLEDHGPSVDLAGVLETLTPDELAESITLMLDANPAWPDQETVAELAGILEQLHGVERSVLLPPGSTKGARLLLPPVTSRPTAS